MPVLLLFAACEKAIVGGHDNELSLVNVFTEYNLPLAASEDLPPDARAAFRWAIVSLWRFEPEDAGSTWEQKAELVRPDGTADPVQSITQLSSGSQFHRVIVQVVGLPVGVPGEFRLRLLLRPEKGKWRELASLPLIIAHTRS